MNEHVDWSSNNLVAEHFIPGRHWEKENTHGSRRITGCPSSPFSFQNFIPKLIIISTNLPKTAFSAGLTILALTGLRAGDMIRMRSGMSSVNVVVGEKRDRRIGGIVDLRDDEISSLICRVWYDFILISPSFSPLSPSQVN